MQYKGIMKNMVRSSEKSGHTQETEPWDNLWKWKLATPHNAVLEVGIVPIHRARHQTFTFVRKHDWPGSLAFAPVTRCDPSGWLRSLNIVMISLVSQLSVKTVRCTLGSWIWAANLHSSCEWEGRPWRLSANWHSWQGWLCHSSLSCVNSWSAWFLSRTTCCGTGTAAPKALPVRRNRRAINQVSPWNARASVISFFFFIWLTCDIGQPTIQST